MIALIIADIRHLCQLHECMILSCGAVKKIPPDFSILILYVPCQPTGLLSSKSVATNQIFFSSKFQFLKPQNLGQLCIICNYCLDNISACGNCSNCKCNLLFFLKKPESFEQKAGRPKTCTVVIKGHKLAIVVCCGIGTFALALLLMGFLPWLYDDTHAVVRTRRKLTSIQHYYCIASFWRNKWAWHSNSLCVQTFQY